MNNGERMVWSAKVILSGFKSLVSGYTQIIWMLLAIIMIKRQDATLLNLPNIEILNNSLNLASKYWLELLITISIFYFIINLKELMSKAEKTSEVKNG